METYKKLSEYDVRTALSMSDLFPTLVSNGDGTYSNKTVPLSAIRAYSAVPPGGTTGQFLNKQSNTDYATQWSTVDKTTVGLSNVDNTSDVNKPVSTATTAAIAAAVSATKQALYPVGSIYINATNSTNPGTLLGFGTWVAFGAGRVPVGFDSTQTEFDTAEETGGAKTHTLTEAQLPNISGYFGIHGQENGTLFASISGYATGGYFGGNYGNLNYHSGSQSYTNPGFNFGQGQAHNNLQPYITVYMWKRTA